jgi:hypothetical protein
MADKLHWIMKKMIFFLSLTVGVQAAAKDYLSPLALVASRNNRRRVNKVQPGRQPWNKFATKLGTNCRFNRVCSFAVDRMSDMQRLRT